MFNDTSKCLFLKKWKIKEKARNILQAQGKFSEIVAISSPVIIGPNKYDSHPRLFPINVLTPRYETMKLREWFIPGSRLLPDAESYSTMSFLGKGSTPKYLADDLLNNLIYRCLTNTEACPLPEATKPVSQVLDIKIYPRIMIFYLCIPQILLFRIRFFSLSLSLSVASGKSTCSLELVERNSSTTEWSF